MEFAIDDLHDNLVTIDQSKFAANVSRELQPSATDKPAFVHVQCTVLEGATE
jgi:hypothetical protein